MVVAKDVLTVHEIDCGIDRISGAVVGLKQRTAEILHTRKKGKCPAKTARCATYFCREGADPVAEEGANNIVTLRRTAQRSISKIFAVPHVPHVESMY